MRKQNQISSIIDENNTLHIEESDIAGAFDKFFVQIYTFSSFTSYNIEQRTKHMESWVSELMALDINYPSTREEVE